MQRSSDISKVTENFKWEIKDGKEIMEKTKVSIYLEQHDKCLYSTTTTDVDGLQEESKIIQSQLLDAIEVVPPFYQAPSIEGIGEISRQTEGPSVVPRNKLNLGKAVVISSFSYTLDGSPSICLSGNDQVLLGTAESMDIHLINRKGEIVLKKENVLGNKCISLVVIPSGHIIVSPLKGNCIEILDRQNNLTTLLDVSPYKTYSISVTENQEILVCMRKIVDGKVTGRVMLCDINGGHQRHIGSDDLFKCPIQAIALQDGGFCISDCDKQRLVALNGDGSIRHIIQKPLGRSWFCPWGICSDKVGNILATDVVNHCVYLIGKDMSVRELVGEDEGIRNPRCICVDEDNNLWISQYTGEIKVVKYLEVQ